MSGVFEVIMPASQMRYTEGDNLIFDTTAFPVFLYPESDEISVTETVTFPDLAKGDAYSYSQGLIGGTLHGGCASYVTLAPQEWGPIARGQIAPHHELADTVIGTIPSAADFLLVYAKVSRTSDPSQINGQTIEVVPQEDAWVWCPGGSLLLEFLPPLARSIDVVLDGTNVVLRRR